MIRIYLNSLKEGELPWAIDDGNIENAKYYEKIYLFGEFESKVNRNFDMNKVEIEPKCWFECDNYNFTLYLGDKIVIEGFCK